MRYSVISEKGQKGFMEDAYYITRFRDALFGAIYDGHKGHQAADYAKGHLHRYFFTELGKRHDPIGAFRMAYLHTSHDLHNSLSGTTASTFYLKEKTLWWAQVGDSALILAKQNGSAELVSDMHNIHNKEERERVESLGGVIMPPYVMKGAYGIAPTRALGDSFFRSIGVIDEPTTGKVNLGNSDRWIIAASDGLLDAISVREVGEFLARYEDPESAAKALKKEALENRHGKDNTTFILVLLEY